MITRVLYAAILAGVLAGLAISAIHFARVVPLIVAAETYEGGVAHEHAEGAPAHGHGQAAGEAPSAGVRRNMMTLAGNVITGIGFAMLLAAAILASGRAASARAGAVWGLAGFLVVSVAPAFGLAPELPGMPAGDLEARQVWWVATVLASAAGGGLIVFSRNAAFRAAGLVLVLLPHIVGAPQPDSHASDVPAGLASAFAAASIGAAGVFWLVLGTATGWLLGRADAAEAT